MRLSRCCQSACRQQRSKIDSSFKVAAQLEPLFSCLPCALLELQCVDAVSPHAEPVALCRSMPV